MAQVPTGTEDSILAYCVKVWVGGKHRIRVCKRIKDGPKRAEESSILSFLGGKPM